MAYLLLPFLKEPAKKHLWLTEHCCVSAWAQVLCTCRSRSVGIAFPSLGVRVLRHSSAGELGLWFHGCEWPALESSPSGLAPEWFLSRGTSASFLPGLMKCLSLSLFKDSLRMNAHRFREVSFTLRVDVVGVFFFFFLMRESIPAGCYFIKKCTPLPFLCFSVTVPATVARALKWCRGFCYSMPRSRGRPRP